jgi:hypothetical protein
MRIVSVEATR